MPDHDTLTFYIVNVKSMEIVATQSQAINVDEGIQTVWAQYDFDKIYIWAYSKKSHVYHQWNIYQYTVDWNVESPEFIDEFVLLTKDVTAPA